MKAMPTKYRHSGRRNCTYRHAIAPRAQVGDRSVSALCVTAQEMREGPSEPPCRRRLQTTLSCSVLRDRVVSVKEKSRQRSWQVWFREMSESEPPLRCRNDKGGVKTGVISWSQDKRRGDLLTAYAASGIQVA